MLSKMPAAFTCHTRITVDPIALGFLLVSSCSVESRVLFGDAVRAHFVAMPTTTQRTPVQGAKVNLTPSFPPGCPPTWSKAAGCHICIVHSPHPLSFIVFQVRDLRTNLTIGITLPIISKVPGFMGLLLVLGQVVLILRDQVEVMSERSNLILPVQHKLAEHGSARQLFLQGRHFPFKRLLTLGEPSSHVHLIPSLV